MAEHDPEKLANALERESKELDRESQELKARIEKTSDDWERKRADDTIPGAPPPEENQSDDPGHTDDT